MFKQAKPRLFLGLVSFWAVLIIGIIGCGTVDDDIEDDDNEWAGTWTFETIDGQSWEQIFEEGAGELAISFSIVANNLTFNDDGTMEWEFAFKFEGNEEGLEFSDQVSVKMTGTYVLSGSDYTITPTAVERTGIDEEDSIGFAEPDTGTWSRMGDTLTLNSDDGQTIVLIKR